MSSSPNHYAAPSCSSSSDSVVSRKEDEADAEVCEESKKKVRLPCFCDSFIMWNPIPERQLWRKKGTTSFLFGPGRCEAKIVRGIGYNLCSSNKHRQYNSTVLTSDRKHCAQHAHDHRYHQACTHCGYFVSLGSVLVCISNVTHVTHYKCAKKFSDGPELVCSHCDSPGVKTVLKLEKELPQEGHQLMLDQTVNPIPDPRFPFFSNRLHHNKKGEQRTADGISISEYRELVDYVLRKAVNGEPNDNSRKAKSLARFFSSPNAVNIVYLLRSISEPFTFDDLMELTRVEKSEVIKLFQAMQISHTFGPSLLNHNDEQQFLMSLAEQKKWTLLTWFLEYFNYKSVDPTMPNSNGISLWELCNTAPISVEHALNKAQYISRISNNRSLFEVPTIVHEDLSKGSERFPVRVVNESDDTPMQKFTYTTRVVDNSGILNARDKDSVVYCTCVGDCTPECDCNSGIYEKGLAHLPSLDWAYLECSSSCSCSMRCNNRVAQKGATYPVEVYRSSDGRGWAVRSLCRIPRGAFIGEYTGELLSDTDANKRIDSYLFETAVGEVNCTIDARLYGNFTRFINHSCEPNAKVGMAVWDSQIEQLSHICIFAVKEIEYGEEITISYGETWWNAKVQEFACLCKKPTCLYTPEKRDNILRARKFSISSNSDDQDERASQ